MTTLFFSPLDTACRFARLTLSELGTDFTLEQEKVWERRREFVAINPAASVPVVQQGDLVLVGANAIAGHFLEAGTGAALLPDDAAERAEVRRLTDWALHLLEGDVTGTLVFEKAMKRSIPAKLGGGAPDTPAMRIARDNLGWHLDYLDHLLASRHWLAGEKLSLADLAFAASLSSLDYLGEVSWQAHGATKAWYARVKSRPSFAPILAERISGVVPPAHYDDPDF